MNITEFRELIAEQLEIDRKVKRKYMSGPNLDVLLKKASQELGCPTIRLDYEIEERGNSGLMRLIRPKDFKILVYCSEIDRSKGKEKLAKDMVAQKDKFAPIPAKMFLHIHPDGIYLKLIEPKNDGDPINPKDVLLYINRLLGEQPNSQLIHQLCETQSCNYTKVAEIKHQPNADARISIRISENRMEAKLIATEPINFGAHLRYEELTRNLRQNGINYGYEENFLIDFCDEPTYNKAIVIAKGILPVDGQDLHIEIFDHHKESSSSEESVKKTKDKQISVNKGAIIGVLHAPSPGQVGYNVLGEILEPVPGKDRPYKINTGCELKPETKEIIALVSGQISFDEEEMSIAIFETFVVEGNLQEDIDFPGSILIKGDVDNGYNIKAEGNITIIGRLGRSEVECAGYLLVKSGINAVDSPETILVKVKGNIYARYITNAGVESEKSVIVSDGILASTVIANEYIISHGKRGTITASTVNSRLGIYANNLGSGSGAYTELIVAMPPKLKEEKTALKQKYQEHAPKYKELKQQLAIHKQKKEIMLQSGGKAKTLLLQQMEKELDTVQADILAIENILQNINKHLEDIDLEIHELAKKAFISNEKKLNSGVVLKIGIYEMHVETDYDKGVSFQIEENTEGIQPKKLEEFDLKPFEPPEN